VWFYLTWRDPRVRDQIAANAAKLEDEKSGGKCDSPCQSNMKAKAGGCCDGERERTAPSGNRTQAPSKGET